jgi:quinol-cytochrome oxidoreductase complex cytochrome b subunit
MLTPLREILGLDVLRTASPRFRLLHLFSAVAVLLLVVQVLSGILLLAYYRPTAAGAFHSLAILVDQVWLGWLVRSLHVWSADFLVLFSVLHFVRVYFAHAYRAPRQLTWSTGIVLLIVLLAFSFTGTLLPWDQYAYWSTETARQTIAAIPILGRVVLDVLWGGWALGEEVLMRFYVAHVAVLPWAAAIFLWLHLRLVWHLGLTDPVVVARRRRGPESPFFPDFVLNMLIAVLALIGILLTVATVRPPPLSDPADPLRPLSPVRPRWYFLPLHQFLREMPGANAALVIVLVAIALFLVPVVDGTPDRRPRRVLVRWGLGIVVLGSSVYLGIRGWAG